jgi:hypothetical protein
MHDSHKVHLHHAHFVGKCTYSMCILWESWIIKTLRILTNVFRQGLKKFWTLVRKHSPIYSKPLHKCNSDFVLAVQIRSAYLSTETNRHYRKQTTFCLVSCSNVKLFTKITKLPMLCTMRSTQPVPRHSLTSTCRTVLQYSGKHNFFYTSKYGHPCLNFQKFSQMLNNVIYRFLTPNFSWTEK